MNDSDGIRGFMSEETKKKRKLTLQQRTWLRCMGAFGKKTFGNATQSAIVAYNLHPEKQYGTARTIGYENMTKLHLEVDDMLNKIGITDLQLFIDLAKQLRAKKPYGKDAYIYADNIARMDAIKTFLKLKGKLTDKLKIEGGFFSAEKIEFVEVKPKTEEI